MNDLTEYWRNMPADEFKRTAEALEASINHWEENARAEKPEDARIFSEDCALCSEFVDYDCGGCPIKELTKKPLCEGSPWKSAKNIIIGWNMERNTADEFHEAAQKELDFLKSLRPSNWGRTE